MSQWYWLFVSQSTSSKSAPCMGATYGSQGLGGLAVICHLIKPPGSILGIQRREGHPFIKPPSAVILVLSSLLVFIWINRMEIKNRISGHHAWQVKIWRKRWCILAWSIFIFILWDISRFLMGKKVSQVGYNQLLNIAHKITWWFCKCTVRFQWKQNWMSLLSNEQKHRKIQKKKQGSHVDLANKTFFLCNRRN